MKLYKNKQWLCDQLNINSQLQIAKKCNVNSMTIKYWMKKFNINKINKQAKCINCNIIFNPKSKSEKICSEKCIQEFCLNNKSYYCNKRKKQNIKDKLTGRKVFHSMKNRCKNIKCYKEKGIQVLIKDFEEFRRIYFRTDCCEWCNQQLSDNNRRNSPNGRQVNRTDSNRHYEESNISIICATCHKYYRYIENYSKGINYFKEKCKGKYPWIK